MKGHIYVDAQTITAALGVLLVAAQTIKTMVDHDRRIGNLEAELAKCLERCPSDDYKQLQPAIGFIQRLAGRARGNNAERLPRRD